MKQCFFMAVAFIFFAQTFSQTSATGKIDSLKDAFGENITYIGEIKSGKPNGLGIAIYNNNFVLRYAGYFVNGKYEGKGVILYKDGSFLSGYWKAGKLNGQGIHFNKDKDLYIGGFVNGEKAGTGTMLYGDNGFLQGGFKNDSYNGRCIYIPGSATVISDNTYMNGKKEGLGYQYELNEKKLYEGVWKNGDWVEATTGNYYSFLKSSSFYAEKTDGQILIGSIDKNNNNVLEDTGFYYDLSKKKRYFGYYHNGLMSSGLIIKDDSSRFVGNLNDDGAYGSGHFLKIGKFYDEGNYVKDYLNGDNSLSINLDKKTVYYGQTIGEAEFSGNAWFANNSNELFNGKYVDGNFSEGWRMDRSGYRVNGIWDKGDIKTVTAIYNEKGESINTNPKTLSEALSIACRAFGSDYFGLEGNSDFSNEYDFLDETYESLVHFPGTYSKDLIAIDDDENNFYVATFKETDDFDEAKEAYDDLCDLTKSTSITLKKGATPFKLSGDIIAIDEEENATISQFVLPASAKGFSDFAISVILFKNYLDEYTVLLACGNKAAVQNWTGE